jgi:hypothetical protein
MFMRIEKFEHLKNYRLRITFSDGSVRDVDLEKELEGEIFEPLKEKSKFDQVFLNTETGTIEWPNGADYAPEFLYEIGGEIKRSA